MKQARALELMSSGCNILLTGSAGSGKSFTIQEFVISRSIALWAKLPDKKVFFWS